MMGMALEQNKNNARIDNLIYKLRTCHSTEGGKT